MSVPMCCPVCSAANTTGPTCRRCKADLSLLFVLESERDSTLEVAEWAVEQEDWETAWGAAARADSLRRDERTCRLRALAALNRYDFAGAWQAFLDRRARSKPAE